MLELTPQRCGVCDSVQAYTLTDKQADLICPDCIDSTRDWLGQNLDVTVGNPLALALAIDNERVWTNRADDDSLWASTKQSRSLVLDPWEMREPWELIRYIRGKVDGK